MHMVPHLTTTTTVIGMEKKVYSNSQTVEFSGNIGVNGNNFSMNYMRIQNTFLLRQQQQNMYLSQIYN